MVKQYFLKYRSKIIGSGIVGASLAFLLTPDYEEKFFERLPGQTEMQLSRITFLGYCEFENFVDSKDDGFAILENRDPRAFYLRAPKTDFRTIKIKCRENNKFWLGLYRRYIGSHQRT